MEKRNVGILVNSTLYKGITTGKTQHERLLFYEEAGSQYNLIPCYFRLQDIKPKQDKMPALIKNNETYVRKMITPPNVIHNRALYFTSSAKKRLEQLAHNGTKIFNFWNRYGKLQIHKILMENMTLRPHLPATMEASIKNLQHMMKQYDCIIIKPNSGSIGRGIMKMERSGPCWKLVYTIEKKPKAWKTMKFSNTIPNVIVRRFKSRKYIVQELLPLATFEQRPFDLRVSVQRNINGVWQVTGIAGKVAKKKAFLTNVAQGGTSYLLEELIHLNPALNYEEIYDKIIDLSLQIAHHLSEHLPNVADIGLDIGITDYGFPMFIECNGRDLRYIFQDSQMIDTWRDSYYNPLGYARYLMDLE